MKLENKAIINISEEFIKNLNLRDFAVFISGSFFFVNQVGYEQFTNGKSDIDIIIICKKNDYLEKSLGNIFCRKVVKKFLKKEYSILNYSYRYGKQRNVLHIKFVSYELFKSIINLKKLSFKSFRRKSLAKKKRAALFMSNSPDSINFPYIEDKIDSGYLLTYQFNPTKSRKFFLSDIHSLILFSICMFDSIKAHDLRTQLLRRMRAHIHKSNNLDDLMQTFQYFSERGYINNHWRKILLEVFLDKKSADLLYYQDLYK